MYMYIKTGFKEQLETKKLTVNKILSMYTILTTLFLQFKHELSFNGL